MKIKALSAAVAVASLLGFSQVSMAAPGAPVSINIAGSSAQDKIIQNFISGICTPGTFTLYSYNGSTSNYWATQCTAANNLTANGATITAGTQITYHKTSANGSIVGVLPLIENKTAPFLNIAAGCTGTVCTTLYNAVPDAGVSDVDPAMFTGINSSTFYTPGSVSSTKALNIVNGAALVIGFPVSLNLYKALQVAQGIAPTANCAVGAYTEACMPNLQSSQIANIISGQISTWDQITYNGNPLTAVQGTNGIPVNNDNNLVHICQREQGSGTSAILYSKILNAPCDANAFTAALDGGAAGPNVEVMSTTGNEENCLVDFADHTNTGSDINGNGDNPNKLTGWAVGWVSSDRNSAAVGATPSLDYRFVKVDGFAPTLANAANGNYKLVGESTFQWLAKNGVTGDALTLVSHLATNEGVPAIVGAYDATKPQPFGQGGFLANSSLGFTDEINLAAPVASYSAAANGTQLDNCKAAIVDISNGQTAGPSGNNQTDYTAQ